MSHSSECASTIARELASLKAQLRKARLREWLSRKKAAYFHGAYQSADARKAIPITSLLRTSEAMVLAVSGIGGSGVGFVIGHALLGWQGASVAIPVTGAIVFFVVARFAFNGSLMDPTSLLQKSEEGAASAERWQATAEGIADLIPQFHERLEQAKERTIAVTAAAPMQPRALPAAKQNTMVPTPRNSGPIQPDLIIDSWEALPPTEKQIGFARHLGIRLTGRERRGELTSLIDSELVKRQSMREETSRKEYRGMQIAPNPGIAVLFNIFWPGVGQVYQGRAIAGLFLMFATPIGYVCLILPGMLLHFIAIADAAFYRPRIR